MFRLTEREVDTEREEIQKPLVATVPECFFKKLVQFQDPQSPTIWIGKEGKEEVSIYTNQQPPQSIGYPGYSYGHGEGGKEYSNKF